MPLDSSREQKDKSATRKKRAKRGRPPFRFKLLILLDILVALPGLEPGLFALRERPGNLQHIVA
jgi:hypothetical protein